MLAYILIAIAAAVALFVIVVATRPSAFRVERSAVISAPPVRVFPHVNDLAAWEAWSPWAKLDPACSVTYDGPPSGVGAVMAWEGNKKVAGRMTITDSRPSDLVKIKLEFLRPFKATNTAELIFKPQGNQTAVSWAMTGKKNFIFKAFGLFFNCDDMVGKDFEKGLAQMKIVVESEQAIPRGGSNGVTSTEAAAGFVVGSPG